jgi:predicted transposase/invertase (TIGR01784 family)
MAEIHNPHDRFFKEVFSHPEAAAEFFAAFLPKEIVALLDISKLEPIKDSFIDPSLQEHLSDLIYSVPLKNGSQAYIYALIEHKSAPITGRRSGMCRSQAMRLCANTCRSFAIT